MEENRLTAEYVGQAISDAQTKEEKERECTDKIVRLAREIVSTYLEYNPHGNYLTLCFSGKERMVDRVPTLHINNNYWEDSFKINHTEVVRDVD